MRLDCKKSAGDIISDSRTYIKYEQYASDDKIIYFKDRLEKLLKKPGGTNLNELNNLFYEMLSTRNNYIRLIKEYGNKYHDKIGFIIHGEFPQQEKEYNEIINNLSDSRELGKSSQNLKDVTITRWGNWLSFDLSPENKKQIDTKEFYKVFCTIPSHNYNFGKHLPRLLSKLRNLSIISNSFISLKTSLDLASFLKHSDSIVVHFKNKNLFEQINRIIDEWHQESKINKKNREQGRATNAFDAYDNSFTQLVAKLAVSYMLYHYRENYKYRNNLELLVKLSIHKAIKYAQNPNLTWNKISEFKEAGLNIDLS